MGVRRERRAGEERLESASLAEEERALLRDMQTLLVDEIAGNGGRLPFDRYMELALYAPGLGYYVNGRRKLGEGGDFTTAPEVSPLFGRCLANQVAQCLDLAGVTQVLELGAGSGKMAADMLAELAARECLPESYFVLEASPSLKAEQRDTLAREVPELLSRVRWLESLPGPGFRGVIVANELLDAMPVHRFRRWQDAWQEATVSITDDGLCDAWVDPFSNGLETALATIWPAGEVPGDGYASEVNLRLAPWMEAIKHSLHKGYLLLIDYGYTRREYYHAERAEGTLIGHFRHRAFADPYRLPGLQDITANVDFTAVAEAGVNAGLRLAGFTTQAHFLIDNGLERLLSDLDPADMRSHLQIMQGVKRLTLPSEMGERFKAIAFACDAPVGLAGFATKDLRDRL
jgi:SAM-dependent MidA family methyltransferase